jgi:hypothetical protein
MWSNKYYYLNICSDEKLSSSYDTQKIKKLLISLDKFKQTSDFIFSNNPDFPFTTITLLKAKNIDSWSDRDVNKNDTNLISIVCTKDNDENFNCLKNVFIEIAKTLNWKLIDEQTDNGIENSILWEPLKK